MRRRGTPRGCAGVDDCIRGQRHAPLFCIRAYLVEYSGGRDVCSGGLGPACRRWHLICTRIATLRRPSLLSSALVSLTTAPFLVCRSAITCYTSRWRRARKRTMAGTRAVRTTTTVMTTNVCARVYVWGACATYTRIRRLLLCACFADHKYCR